MKHKPFKTIDEQVDLLLKKGLIIPDYDYARFVLSECNYYRLSGYTLTLRKNDHFYKNVTFENVMQLYYFDKDLRLFLLDLLEDIEISLRTHVAYVLGSQDTDPNSSPSYLLSENYINDTVYSSMMKTIPGAISESNNEAFVKHHLSRYDGLLPVWALVEILSFGKLSKLFGSLNISLQKEICNNYYSGKKFNIVSNWMEGLVVLRNMCAHKVRLINRGIVRKPKFSSKENDFFISNGYEPAEIGTRIFFRLLIIDRLSSDSKIHNRIKQWFAKEQEKYPFVDLKHYGFKKTGLKYSIQ